MTAKHIMDSRARRKAIYINKHEQLRAELRKPEPSKSERKRAASMMFHRQGEA